MTNPTDTNQASEDEPTLSEIRTSFVMRILKKRVYYGKSHETKLSDLQIAANEIFDYVDDVIETGSISLVRTEKLKLLVAVRGRVVGHSEKHSEKCIEYSSTQQIDKFCICLTRQRNVLRNEQLTALTKLEAEL